MKIKDIKQSLYSMVFCLLVMAGVMGCESNEISVNGGQMPETGGLDNTFAVLTSINHAENEILLDINKASATDGCCVKLTRPAAQTMKFIVTVDESRVESYNMANDTQYPILPANYVTMTNEGVISLETGKIRSSEISVTVNYDEYLKPGIYLLPLSIKKNAGEVNIAESRQTLYYFVNVWPEFDKNKYELGNKGYVQIGYLDPEELNPLLINEIYLMVRVLRPTSSSWYDILFDIVNLQGGTVELDKQGEVKLKIKEDLNYVLNNKKKYLMPLQVQKHKVCLSITGGRQGIGFSNLTKDQCSSLVYQIKKIIEFYNLDGVNILDRNNLYNLSSEKFVSKENLLNFMAHLRSALPDKLITFAESEETPSGLEQTVNDLKLGELVNYAWVDDINNAFNPWLDDSVYKPIVGLKRECWGVVVTKPTSDNDEYRKVDETTRKIAVNGVDKVYIHYLIKNKSGLETSFAALLNLGGSINWHIDIPNNKWNTATIESPREYLDIHSNKWMKDW